MTYRQRVILAFRILRLRRDVKKLNRRKFAKLVGIRVWYLADIEEARVEPDLATLRRIAKFLETTPEHLLRPLTRYVIEEPTE